ncbi:MAG: response regulator [Pseudomonadota bacterium]
MTKTIAVIDDDVAILDSIQLLLELQGWQVRTYDTGEEFVEGLVDGDLPDCAILDPNLPGISGADVARAIACHSIPIIGLTARPTCPAAKEMLQEGARAILTKPVTEGGLLFQLRAVLGAP